MQPGVKESPPRGPRNHGPPKKRQALASKKQALEAVRVPALGAGIPAQERVVRGHLAAPCSRDSADCTQVLQQVPEAGDSMSLSAGHTLRG